MPGGNAVAEQIRRDQQYRLLRVMLALMAAYGAVIGLVNLLLFDALAIAAFDLATMGIALATWVYLRRSGRLKPASWVAIATLAALLLAYTALARGAAYSLVWVTVLPPLAFFLLGSRAGSWVAGAFGLMVAGYIAAFHPGFPVRPFDLGAFLNIVEVLLAHWLIHRFSERCHEAAYEQLGAYARVDGLTGLLNREQLDAELRQALSLASRSGQPVAVALLDLDHFKAINDRHGHPVGDQVLVTVARVLGDVVRSTDRVGRWGGEEFLLLLPETGEAGARAVAEKVRAAIEAAAYPAGVVVTTSIGVAWDPGGLPPQSLVARADKALYEAKAAGRNRVVAWTPSVAE
ncbi:MAG: GGDEF domain-containing protein [Pseudohaliea sp.]